MFRLATNVGSSFLQDSQPLADQQLMVQTLTKYVWATTQSSPQFGCIEVLRRFCSEEGLTTAAEIAIQNCATRLAVSTIDQAIVLRMSGISLPIQVLSPCSMADMAHTSAPAFEFSTECEQDIKILASEMRRGGGKHGQVWLRVSTGNDEGAQPEEVWPLISFIAADRALELTGVFSMVSSIEAVDTQSCLLKSLARYCAERASHFPKIAIVIV